MRDFDFKYLYFDPVNLMKEIKKDEAGAIIEYNRVANEIRYRVADLQAAGYTVHKDIANFPEASGLSRSQLAQSLSQGYNFLTRKSSTVEGVHATNRERSRALKSRGINVNPWEVEAFGRFFGLLTGSAQDDLFYELVKELWDKVKRKWDTSKLSEAWDDYKKDYEEELSEKSEKFVKYSERAKKGWATRKKRAAEKAKRSAAARRGWETRRKNQGQK